MWTFIIKTGILLAFGFTTEAAILSSTHPISWALPEAAFGVSRLPIDCAGFLKLDALSPSHCSNCFGVIPAGTGRYSLFYSSRNGESLDYDTAKSYIFNLSCDEGTTTSTGNVILRVIPNFPPTFQDISSIITVSSATSAGGQVYDPNPRDEENDPLTFTLEEIPDNGFFQIDANGKIVAKKDLNIFCKQETVVITMQDGSNPPVNKTITFDQGGNTKPILKDWNRSIRVPENVILELPITDNLGLKQDGSCFLTVNPPEYSSYFDSTLECPNGAASRIITPAGGKTFNFEVDPPVNISLFFDNGNCPSDPRWLYIEWTDVPEPPTLILVRNQFITKEGLIEIKPDYEIQDDDATDKHVYSFVDPAINPNVSIPANPNFRIDPYTGRIYTPEYYMMDCEEDRLGFIFNVQVTDQNGNVSNHVQVKLNLTDVNDNQPRFTRRFDPSPALYADCIQPFVLVDLSDDVVDDDCEKNTNGALEFVEASSGSLSISKDGVVRLTKPPIAGQVDILQIRAIDKGEPPQLSEAETISVLGFPCPTTSPPVIVTQAAIDNNYHTHNYVTNNNNIDYNNDNNYNNNNNDNNVLTSTIAVVVPEAQVCFFDNPWTIATVALAAFLGLVVWHLLLYLCYRYCGPLRCDACRHRRRIPPLRANKVKPIKVDGDDKGKDAKKRPEEVAAKPKEGVDDSKTKEGVNGSKTKEGLDGSKTKQGVEDSKTKEDVDGSKTKEGVDDSKTNGNPQDQPSTSSFPVPVETVETIEIV